jgi:hypothetical protein
MHTHKHMGLRTCLLQRASLLTLGLFLALHHVVKERLFYSVTFILSHSQQVYLTSYFDEVVVKSTNLCISALVQAGVLFLANHISAV